jgi:hypothetical protein
MHVGFSGRGNLGVYHSICSMPRAENCTALVSLHWI